MGAVTVGAAMGDCVLKFLPFALSGCYGQRCRSITFRAIRRLNIDVVVSDLRFDKDDWSMESVSTYQLSTGIMALCTPVLNLKLAENDERGIA